MSLHRAGDEAVISGIECCDVAKVKRAVGPADVEKSATQAPRLAAAVRGSGVSNLNFSISGVPGGLISSDGTRVYRAPSAKPSTPAAYNSTGIQASFQEIHNGKRYVAILIAVRRVISGSWRKRCPVWADYKS